MMKTIQVIKEIPENLGDWITLFKKRHKGTVHITFYTNSTRYNMYIINTSIYLEDLKLGELEMLPMEEFKTRIYENHGWDCCFANWELDIELNIETEFCLKCDEKIHFRCNSNEPLSINENKGDK